MNRKCLIWFCAVFSAGSGAALAQDSDAVPEFRDHGFWQFDTPTSRSADVTLGDMDGDGDLDALVANGRHWAEQDYLFLNAGNGRFLEAVPIGRRLSASYTHRIGDYDGDGDLDMVTLRDMLPAQVRMNDGQGSFAPARPLENTAEPVRSGASGDLDGDGFLDIVIATRRGPDLVLFGQGTGDFDAPVALPDAGRGTTGAAIGDLTGDGRADILLARRDDSPSVIMVQHASRQFTPVPLDDSLGDHRKALIGDFDGDNINDALLVSTDGRHKLYAGADGAVRVIDRAGQATQALAAGDMNGDGRLDLVSGNDGENYLLLSQTGGAYEATRLPGGEADTYGVSIGDMNNDGKLDIVIANSGARNLVLIQR